MQSVNFLWLIGQFNIVDIFFAVLFIIIILLISRTFKPKEQFIRSYYYIGITIKIFGGILFWYIHCEFYDGGDSWAYYYSSKALGELFLYDFASGWDIFIEYISGVEILNYFNNSTWLFNSKFYY